MYLQKLSLKNFRNYESLDVSFNKSVNVFIGKNGQGKTNILESIYFLSFLKSHRTNKNIDLITFNKDNTNINASLILENSKNLNVGVFIDTINKKRIFVNSMKVLKISEFLGYVKSIMFSPEDLKLIKESPPIRRKFLDMSISQINNKYLRYIISYNKLLNMKNSLLKKHPIDETLLDIYDEKISIYSSFIICRRIEYINILKDISYKLHERISNFREKLNIEYINFLHGSLKSFCNDCNITDIILDILRKNRKIDKVKKFSTIGIHRDDFKVYLNGKQMYNYSSQGQQRSAVISIKFAVIEIIKKLTNNHPILLLDDILSELDKSRRDFILNSVDNTQTFITCTELQEKILNSFKIFDVEDGKIL